VEIFASTGGFRNLNFYEAANKLIDAGCRKIELSAGRYISNPRHFIKLLQNDCELMLHNYFPVPAEPFVINLSSSDSETLARSLDLTKAAIDISSEIGSQCYGVHSGFRADLQVGDLGRVKHHYPLISKKQAVEIFKRSITELAIYASKKNVNLMVENNVLTKSNINLFGTNPFLMVDPLEIRETLESLDCEITLLLDLAHLKISAETLKFDLDDSIHFLNPLVNGYQVSENDGIEDDGLPFDDSVWFLNLIDKSKNFVTIELSEVGANEYRSTEVSLRRFLG
jgi:sugar phosphate isomerase/epimerase